MKLINPSVDAFFFSFDERVYAMHEHLQQLMMLALNMYSITGEMLYVYDNMEYTLKVNGCFSLFLRLGGTS